ncbi:MAG: hypothetical protein STHCBS139747_000465 [Sporothrix thermara]
MTGPAASFDSPLRISLFHASLDNPPEYEALSYVWGKSWGQFTVHIQDAHAGDDGNNDDLAQLPALPVTPNLDRALRHLRFRIKKAADGSATIPHARVLWVDALCINQQDPAERSRQVQQMRRIYELCVADVAWLGPIPSRPLTDKQVEDTKTDSDVSDGEKDGDPIGEGEPDELAQERRQAEKWAKKRAKAERCRVTAYERAAQRLRDGVALMRKVAARDAATLSQMVQDWNARGGDALLQSDADEDEESPTEPKDE